MTLRTPSKRFLRAAEAERAQLLAHHELLLAQQEVLLDEVARNQAGIHETKERLAALDTVLGIEGGETRTNMARDIDRVSQTALKQNAPNSGLRGPAVREVAVKVLLRQPEYVEAIHYRDWYQLLIDAGYAIVGKDPRAVFLTQLTRSPVVRKSAQPGVYELDRQAPLRLRQRYERLQSELREITDRPQIESTTNAARARQLSSAVDRTERELDEALRVLHRQTSDPGTETDHEQARRLSA